MDKEISIRFCGGCNPRIDRGKLAAEIKAALAGMGCTVAYNQPDAGFIICLSGCTANCASRYIQSSTPGIIVAGESLDALFLAESQLAGEILRKVREWHAKLAKHLPA